MPNLEVEGSINARIDQLFDTFAGGSVSVTLTSIIASNAGMLNVNFNGPLFAVPSSGPDFVTGIVTEITFSDNLQSDERLLITGISEEASDFILLNSRTDQGVIIDFDVNAFRTFLNNQDWIFSGRDTDDFIAPGNNITLGGDDTISGRGGNDTLDGGEGDDTLDGGADNDTLIGGIGADELNGGSGIDTVDYSASVAALTMTSSTQVSGGHANSDVLISIENIIGTQFSDTLRGNGNSNQLFGNVGADTLIGGAGHDTLDSGEGTDLLIGDSGNDVLQGGNNSDIYIVGAGDLVTDDGSVGFDRAQINDAAGVQLDLIGWSGVERVNGFTGDDVIDATGATSDYIIAANAGSDTIIGGDGNDTFFAGSGDDSLSGANGNDALIGGDGENTLVGGAGNDFLLGGGGADTFVFENAFGSDVIRDYADSVDTLDFSNHSGVNSLADLNISQNGLNTIITLSNADPDQITLVNVTATDLDAGDFTFS